VEVVLASAGEKVIDHEMVRHVDAEACVPEERFETRAEAEDEIRVGSAIPGHPSRTHEDERPNVPVRELVRESPSVVPGGDSAPAEIPVEAPQNFSAAAARAFRALSETSESLETDLTSEL
jgi:hypothetical protein